MGITIKLLYIEKMDSRIDNTVLITWDGPLRQCHEVKTKLENLMKLSYLLTWNKENVLQCKFRRFKSCTFGPLNCKPQFVSEMMLYFHFFFNYLHY